MPSLSVHTDRPHTQEHPPGTILVVDDEPAVAALLAEWLADAGYDVTSANSAADALHQLDHRPIGVALCDIRLPGESGLWLAERIRRAHPTTAVVMVSGLRDVAPVVQSLRHGVVDYLTKPFDRDRLADAMGRAMQWHAAAVSRRREHESLEREIETQRLRLADAIAALRLEGPAQVDAVLALLTAGHRDACTHAHRVAALAAALARAMGIAGEELVAIECGALLHEIGRLALLDPLLRAGAGPAPAALDEPLVRRHPALGAALLERVPYLAGAAVVVRDAHERMDGLGFPDGRRGEAIARGGRVVAVADAFDTLTRMPRGPALTPTEAVLEIVSGSGTIYDPAVVSAIERLCTP